MKIKNDFVNIKTENKNVTIKNTILDVYLDELAKGNLGNGSKRIKVCCIKLDTSLQFDVTSKFTRDDFELMINLPDFYETPSKNSNVIQYFFYVSHVYAWNKEKGTSTNININDYKDRKICTLGFKTSDIDNMVAMVDVSKYDLRINSFLSICRKDIISTDFEFKSNEFDYPLHLLFEDYLMTYKNYSTVKATLKEIGFSDNKDEIKERIAVTNTSVQNGTLTIKDLTNYDSFARTYLPTYLSFYPTKKRYNHIFYIYEVTGYTYNPTTKHVMGEYYEIGECNMYGEVEANIKYERS